MPTVKKLTILIAMLMATSAWAEWTYMNVNINDSVTYVNYDSVERVDNRLFTWILTDYAIGNQSSGVKSVISYQETDCGVPRKSRNLVLKFKDGAMGEGKDVYSTQENDPEWIYNQPGSVGLFVIDALCDSTEPKSNSD